MSNYIKLTNNLDVLKLERIKQNLDKYIELININGESYRLKDKIKIEIKERQEEKMKEEEIDIMEFIHV